MVTPSGSPLNHAANVEVDRRWGNSSARPLVGTNRHQNRPDGSKLYSEDDHGVNFVEFTEYHKEWLRNGRKFNMNQYSVDYLRGQLYFDPHPKELMLRNHC